MNATVLSLGLYEGSGGPSKSIRFFRDALDAAVISWVDPKDTMLGKPVFKDATKVEGFISKILFARGKQCQAAESLVRASDLISCHSFYRYHNAWIQRVARRYGKPYWFVPHGSLDPWVLSQGRTSKQIFQAIWGNRFLEGASAVVFSTEREKEKASSVFVPKKSRVVYWPLHESDFIKPTLEERETYRKKLGVGADAFVLAYFGRLDPMKRPLETIRAFAAAKLEDAILVVAGNSYGVSEKECRELSQSLGVERRVRVVGPVYGDEKRAFLAGCDAYISLSHRENFNYCAAESLAAGLPVILSEGNDLAWDLVSNGFCIRLPEEDVILSAALAIKSFAALLPGTRRELGDQGREWALANLRFDQFRGTIRSFADEAIRSFSS